MKTSLNKYKVIILLIVVAFCVGRFSSPKNVETKEIEKIVLKDRIVKNEKNKTKKLIRETILPDGTKIREIIEEESSESHLDSNHEVAQEHTKESQTLNQSEYSVGLYSNGEFLAGTVDRRLFGGLFLGVYGRTQLPLGNSELGVGLRLEF